MPKIKKDISVFQVTVLVLLGFLIALTSFLTWEYTRVRKLSDNLRNDIATIVQSYNNLVTSLQTNGILGTTTEVQE
jgi:hypothetical protein